MVIAIIAILAAILLPVLNKAKSKAWRATCLNNMHQLGLTWHVYTDDYNGRVALNGYGTERLPGSNRTWVVGDEHVVPQAYQVFTDPQYTISPRYALFGDYLQAAKVYKCPADRGTVNGGDLPRVRNYALNSYFGWTYPDYDNNNDPNYYSFYKVADLAGIDSSKIYTFMDTAPPNVCFAAFVVFMGNSGWFFHRPTIEHDYSGTMAFADGHVEAHKWLEQDTYTFARDGGAGDGHHFAFVNPNNRDLLWLQDHTTVKK